jgi:2-amino-4-hydroxy-6-hydroxymethyldihydropteridine diphosphokinase
VARPEAVSVALGLGGNVAGAWGDAEATLARALDLLRQALGPLRIASLYRTDPVSPMPQPPFLNTAALAVTAWSPEAVLGLGKALELAAGRRRGPRLGPRPLDVDLLVWGDRAAAAPELTLPHPHLRARRFALAPLAEIAPDLPVPPDGATVADLLARLGAGGADDRVERVGWRTPPAGPALETSR